MFKKSCEPSGRATHASAIPLHTLPSTKSTCNYCSSPLRLPRDLSTPGEGPRDLVPLEPALRLLALRTHQKNEQDPVPSTHTTPPPTPPRPSAINSHIVPPKSRPSEPGEALQRHRHATPAPPICRHTLTARNPRRQAYRRPRHARYRLGHRLGLGLGTASGTASGTAAEGLGGQVRKELRGAAPASDGEAAEAAPPPP